MAPTSVHKTAHRIVAGMGQDSRSLTWEKYLEKGVASSLARTQNSRPTICGYMSVSFLCVHTGDKTYSDRCDVANKHVEQDDEEQTESGS
jgi:hypothetical protein